MHPHVMSGNIGWIEVITGCMFSGKTEELIRRMRRAQFAHQSVVIFKPRIDDRYTDDSVGSHSGNTLRSMQIDRAEDIMPFCEEAEVVGIDEAQFLGDALVDICEELANQGKRVVVAGLDLDYLGRPFEPMPHLLAKAEYIQKVHAICVMCGNIADRTQRVVNRDARVLVGAEGAYEARCRLHWDPEGFSPKQAPLPLGPNLAETTAP